MADDFSGFTTSFTDMLSSYGGGGGSTSNPTFPSFATPAPMSADQLAFLESQQEEFQAFQLKRQQQQLETQQSQSSNSIPTTTPVPKKSKKKNPAKVTNKAGCDPTGWTPDEEALLAECWVGVSEDSNVDRHQPKDTLWIRVMNVFNERNFQYRTKDMISSKLKTINHHCRKFNDIFKKCVRNKKSGENEVSIMRRAGVLYQDENRNSAFGNKKAWSVLKKYPKWDAPDVAPVDLTGNEPNQDDAVPTPMNTDELFRRYQRPRLPGKQRPRKKTKSDNIPPFEIQTEIIKRAPVKSIVRFRSVSKAWRSLIDSSEFIAGYRARKTQPRSLLCKYLDNSSIYCRSFKYVCVNDEDTFAQQQDLTPNVSALMKQIHYLRVIGYSRGLLCLHSGIKGGTLVLWNPSIRRSVSIIGLDDFDLFGFAVCPVTNEPTIVKISEPWKVGVFTLSSKKWMVIECIKPACECDTILDFLGTQVVIDSSIYRIQAAYGKSHLPFPDKYLYVIVSFDLNAKEFKAIDLPDTIANLFTSHGPSISKLKGSLVVIVPCGEIKVWKMEPDCSFTQLFTINTLCITDILRFRKNGELVVATQETPTYWGRAGTNSALEVYDPCSKRITNLGMYGQSASFFISSYKETLLLLDHSDSCEYPEII